QPTSTPWVILCGRRGPADAPPRPIAGHCRTRMPTIGNVAHSDLKRFIGEATAMFDDPDAAAREAFQTAAAIISLGDAAGSNLAEFADYLGWTLDQTQALASKGVVFRTSPPPTLRSLI